MATTKKKRSFDAAFKLRFVKYAEQDTNRGPGRKFGVDEKRVREWRKQKDELQTLPSRDGRKNTNYRYVNATFQEL